MFSYPFSSLQFTHYGIMFISWRNFWRPSYWKFFFLTYFKLLFLFHTQVYSFWYLRTSQCSSQRFVLCLDNTNLVSQKDCFIFLFLKYTCHLLTFYKSVVSLEEGCLLPLWIHKYLKKTTKMEPPIEQPLICFMSLLLTENTHLVNFNSRKVSFLYKQILCRI